MFDASVFQSFKAFYRLLAPTFFSKMFYVSWLQRIEDALMFLGSKISSSKMFEVSWFQFSIFQKIMFVGSKVSMTVDVSLFQSATFSKMFDASWSQKFQFTLLLLGSKILFFKNAWGLVVLMFQICADASWFQSSVVQRFVGVSWFQSSFVQRLLMFLGSKVSKSFNVSRFQSSFF